MKLEQSLVELQQLFIDMSTLVAAQSEMVDRICDNIDQTAAYVRQGTLEVKKARYYQRHRFKLTPVSMSKLL